MLKAFSEGKHVVLQKQKQKIFFFKKTPKHTFCGNQAKERKIKKKQIMKTKNFLSELKDESCL